jgi:hypothetical protein
LIGGKSSGGGSSPSSLLLVESVSVLAAFVSIISAPARSSLPGAYVPPPYTLDVMLVGMVLLPIVLIITAIVFWSGSCTGYLVGACLSVGILVLMFTVVILLGNISYLSSAVALFTVAMFLSVMAIGGNVLALRSRRNMAV